MGDESGERDSARRRRTFAALAAGGPLVVAAIVVAVLMQGGVITIGDGYTYLQEPGHERTGHKYIHDPLLGWRNIPSWRATTHGKPLSINAHGLRSVRDYAYDKPRDVKRVLVLGDSYAWGYGVGDEEVFAHVLDQRLNDASASADPGDGDPGAYEVLNAGVSGWGTDQAYLYLIEEGLRYSPDVVVLALFIVNDMENNSWSRQYGLEKPVFLDTSLTRGNIPVPTPGSTPTPAWKRRDDRGDDGVLRTYADPLELTVAIIAKMAHACAEHECELVVMKFGGFLFPDSEKLREATAQFEQLLREKASVAYLDLDAAFAARGIPTPQLLEGNDDGHWNAFGHRVTAEILHEYLAKQRFFDDPR